MVYLMGMPEDLLDKMRQFRGLGYIPPSDLEIILRELRYLRSEIEKIKRALEKHGIKVE